MSLTGAYAALGESVTVDGSSVTAIFDTGFDEAYGAAGTGPSLRCIAADVSTAAVGDSVVRASVTYTIRTIQPIAPDALETRLILERA